MSATTETPGFYPIRLNPFLIWFVQTISLLPAARWRYKIDLQVEPGDLERLRALKGHRRLLLPNHPTFQDPIVIFLLSAKLRQTFYYLAAYETFKGLLGRFLQSVGVYSIRRGIADRPSIAYTLDLMTQPDCCLVIFPEGGCSFQNDTVMPFRVGGVQLAFQVLSRFARRGEDIPNFYVVPVSIKYRYTQDMTPAIQASLHQLETKLGLPGTGNHYERLRAIAKQVLINLEKEYGFSAPETAQQSWNDRIAALKFHVIQECEQHLSMQSTPGEPIRERVYRIQYALQTIDELQETNIRNSRESDSQEPQLENTWTPAAVQKAMFRLLNFDAIHDSYVAENPTPERFLDTLTRLEREVFDIDQPPPKGHRLARVKVGEPINLKDFFEEYQQNRNRTIDQLVSTIQQTVQANLNQLS
ncbi:MAG: 1-acyl-sn-glycerol-3-phosphate acyltransferase [Leptolyngbyaceae cyanobacterium HOT.MB2.61]|jgi:1-acyl-sn-glycerol-3-phosphate acyltransferase|nr:1-acyl-sn-glycerol-3-phosphate acyltransferase [Leptolyngbyaceae cyanobacterium HOT.MB2.61]